MSFGFPAAIAESIGESYIALPLPLRVLYFQINYGVKTRNGATDIAPCTMATERP